MSHDTSQHAYALRHSAYIESGIANDPAASIFEQRIKRSWQRCLKDHSLDPARHTAPPIVDSAELRRRRASTAGAYEVVRAQVLFISRAFTQAAAIVFTDTDGVILSCVGERTFATHAYRAGLRVGAVWSESEQGTNGMGTCLVEREPIVVERHAHFLAQHAALTCFAAPVFGGQGQLLGALNISSQYLLSREPMLALLNLAVADIERRLLLQQSAGQRLLQFGPRRAHVGTALEGMMTFDGEGLITGANQAAIGWLGVDTHADVCGKSICRFFCIDESVAESLDGSFRCGSAAKTEERTHYYCNITSARAVPPANPQAASLPMSMAVAATERSVLLEALQRSEWNVSRAARALRIGRKTLYRKMHKHHLLSARGAKLGRAMQS